MKKLRKFFESIGLFFMIVLALLFMVGIIIKSLFDTLIDEVAYAYRKKPAKVLAYFALTGIGIFFIGMIPFMMNRYELLSYFLIMTGSEIFLISLIIIIMRAMRDLSNSYSKKKSGTRFIPYIFNPESGNWKIK